VRSVVPANITLITPGVRPEGGDLGDQVRVATPQQAISDGADLVVIGRPITGAVDISGSASHIAQSLLTA
jgi:orotidine-5'-phosphate decarboxylase